MKFRAILIILIALINSCTSNHSNKLNNPSKECIKLNNDGVASLMNYPTNGEKGLNQAIDLLKQAIKCDSTYLNAYLNLTSAYDRKGSYHEEVITYNKILVLTNNDPTILVFKGVLFEKMNKIDSAKQAYHLSKTEYEERLAKNPDDIAVIKGIIRLKAITEGKDEAINELSKQIKMHPNLSSKLSNEYNFYKDFDRQAYIHGNSK